MSRGIDYDECFAVYPCAFTQTLEEISVTYFDSTGDEEGSQITFKTLSCINALFENLTKANEIDSSRRTLP